MAALRRGLAHPLPKSGGSAPGFTGTAPVTHAMAVGADASQAVETGLRWTGDVKGSDMVHFDVALAELPVCTGEVEVTHLAPQRAAALPYLLDLLCAELRVSLARESPTDEEASLNGGSTRLADLVGLPGNEMQLTGADAVFDGLGGLEHLSLTFCEGVDHEQSWLAAPRGCARVEAVVSHEVGGLAADAVGRSEVRQCERFRLVDGQRAEQLREFLYLRVPSPQLMPIVLHDERTGQYEFIFSPRRYPHE